MSEKIKAKKTLDTCGLRCPEPLMLIRKTIRTMQDGEILLVIGDDPATVNDVSSFCRFMKHQLLNQQISAKPFTYLIKKGL